MRRAAVICVLVASSMSAGAALFAQAAERRVGVSIEATSLVFGLAAGAPRLALSVTAPLGGAWSLEMNPSASWGGEGDSASADAVLPLLIRFEAGRSVVAPFAAGGAYLGAGRLAAGGDWSLAAGPAAEIGARFALNHSRFIIEAYGGASIGAVLFRGDSSFLWQAYGGLRLGVGLDL
jgi:hypothetical protein